MSIIISLTLIHVLMINSFYRLRSLRAERRIFVQILIITATIILFNTFINPIFQGNIQQYFSCSIGLSLASFSSLFLRQVVWESRTSIYLVFLAMFPFTLFYIFYVFHHIFAFELYKGDVYVILDFFFVKAQSSLLAFSMLYDWVLFQGKKNNGNRLVASIDGQLARRLYYIKLVIISMTVFSSLFYDFNTWHTFSEAIYATLVLLILIYFLGGKKLVFKKHSKLWVAQSQLNYQLSTKQREGIHSHFNRLKKVIEKKIATKRNKQVEIKQVQAKHFAVERRNNFQCYPALKIFHRIYDFWLALVIDCKNLRSYGSLL